MIDKLKNLKIMLNHFPSWMDIKKRYNKSVGGAVLQSYNDEIDNTNLAIKEYQDLFFLLSYYKKEKDIPAYMYIALIGSKDLSSISVPVLQHKEYLTNNVDEFYKNLSTHILYQDDALIIHPSFFNEEKPPDGIEYIIDNTYKYKSKLYYRHIWNVFDEFALFSGLKRYELESNEELSNRVIQQFKNFPNAGFSGLKNAIKNALYNMIDIDDASISIERPNAENMTDTDIYNEITEYNKDLFRVKKWDTSLWEHGFKTSDLLPHEWDKQPEEYQDGTGSKDDLKIDFVDNIDMSDNTDILVTGYKKSRKAITEYLKNNNIETDIKLGLTKLKNNVTPQKIEYKIIASDIVKIDAEKIHVVGSRKYSGKNTYYIEDYITESDGIDKIARNILPEGKDYKIIFEPLANYSDMKIVKTDIVNSSGTKSLLTENDTFIFKNNELVNKNVLAHIASLNDMTSFDNLKNYNGGFTLESISDKGTASIALDKTMSFGMLNIDCECKEADITDNSNYVKYSNFELNDAGTTLNSLDGSSNSSINISLPKCRSFSFKLDNAVDQSKQGAIYVTITRNGSVGRKVLYTKSTTISASYNTTGKTEILIQRVGQNNISISNIRAAMYDVQYRLDTGNIIQNVMYAMLPNISKNNTLNIDIIAYTAYAPIIKSIHIGNSLIGAKYVIDFHTNEQSSLYIESTCKVTLINKTDGITRNNYTTKALYRNNSNTEAYIFLNTSGFSNINSSSPTIKHKFNGTAKDFIIVQPGEEIDSITIDGDNKKTVFDKTLSSILYNNEPDYEVYISRIIQSFIIKHNNHESLFELSKSSLNTKADIFEYTGLDSSINGLYIIEQDKNNTYIGNSLDKNFQFMCLYPVSSQEYTAYNTKYILKNVTNGIELDNTFSPIISFTKKYLFMICDVYDINRTRKTTVSFCDDDGERNWSTFANTPIKISSNFDFNNEETYDTDVSEIHDKYILSNEIILNDTYIINGEEVELAEYIITPPAGIKIKYDKYECLEELIAENDGFNKLKYSNIVKIISVYENNQIIQPTEYKLMKNEGVLIWLNENYTGKTLQVKYVMNKPVSMEFVDEDILYDKIKYSIDAYDKIQSINFTNVKDKDVLYPQFKENPDKLIIKQSNENFHAAASSDNKSITISKVKDSNKLAIHNGYLYEDGLEYYYFADKYEDFDSRTKELDMINTSILGNKLLFRMKSTNYLPHSSMTQDSISKSTNFDFTDKKYAGISGFNSLTACDTFGHWNLFNMTANMVSGVNGYGMSFASKDNDKPSYALMEITNQIINGNIISVFKNGISDIYICKESKVDKLPLVKDIYIEKQNIIPLENIGKYFYNIITTEREPETRYFILIYGKSCVIDDIVAMKYTSLDDMVSSHTKNIDRLNLKIVEKPSPNTTRKLKFNYDNAIYNYTERSSTEPTVITTTMSTAYGHTKITDVDLSNVVTINSRYKNGYILAEDNNAEISTKPIFIKARKSAANVTIKINNVMIDNMYSFNIDVYGCSSKDGEYKKIKTVKSANIVIITGRNIKSYIKVVITGIDKNKIINSISVYAEYAETDSIELLSTPERSGTFTSMIYDIGADINFMPISPDYEINKKGKVDFYYRGARENKNTIVFTDWYKINIGDNEKYNHILNNYRFVQFRTNIKSQDTEVSIKDFVIRIIE